MAHPVKVKVARAVFLPAQKAALDGHKQIETFNRDRNKATLYIKCMIRLSVVFVGFACLAYLQSRCNAEDDSLKNKIVRATLNQNVPAVIKVGTSGVTSLEFPYKVEAIDGYGFSPTPSGGDGFQISYARGNNFFSVRALKPGVTGNLTVVLDQKVYSLFFRESSEPVFATIFEPAGASPLEAGKGPKSVEGKKAPSPNPLVGLIDKAKGYSTLNSSSPELFEGLRVAEPEKKNIISEGVESIIHRVIRDDSLDSLVFDVEIDNRSAKDFLYDPEGIQVRTKDQVYAESTADAVGIVKAQTSATVFFAVTGAATRGGNKLAPENDFDLVVRGVTGSIDKGMKFSEPPGDFLPTETTVGHAGSDVEPPLPQEHGLAKMEPQTVPANQVGSKKGVKKADPKPQNKAKEIVVKTQKPPPKKLFGWL